MCLKRSVFVRGHDWSYYRKQIKPSLPCHADRSLTFPLVFRIFSFFSSFYSFLFSFLLFCNKWTRTPAVFIERIMRTGNMDCSRVVGDFVRDRNSVDTSSPTSVSNIFSTKYRRTVFCPRNYRRQRRWFLIFLDTMGLNGTGVDQIPLQLRVFLRGGEGGIAYEFTHELLCSFFYIVEGSSRTIFPSRPFWNISIFVITLKTQTLKKHLQSTLWLTMHVLTVFCALCLE